jgi:predicted molibdopterin-dependent oxidoreductase YjgC
MSGEKAALSLSLASPDGRTTWQRDPAHPHATSVLIVVDGKQIEAYDGECLATALAVAGLTTLRHSPNAGGMRGVFCLMGSCQECLVHVNGAPVVACLEPVKAGMQIVLDRFVRERAVASSQSETP